MRLVFLILGLFSLAYCAEQRTQHVARAVNREENLRPAAHPSDKFCRVAKDWQSAKFSPQELCEKYKGEYCESIKDYGPALCAANGKTLCTKVNSVGQGLCVGGEGTLCDGIQTIAAGICTALRQDNCLSANNDKLWDEKLKIACGW